MASDVRRLFPAAAGVGVVPSSLLTGNFDPIYGPYIVVRSVRYVPLQTGTWGVVLHADADADALGLDGKVFSAQLRLQ
jgi:hypothetical protein